MRIFNSMHMYQAANSNDADAIRRLLLAGADINQQYRSVTPLMAAVCEGGNEAFAELMQNGANVDIQERSGATALMFAAMHGYRDFVVLLLDAGAQVDIQDRKGWSALHHATQANMGEIMSLILARGADASRKTVKQQTPLDIAIECKHIKAASVLTRGGARFEETLASGSRTAKKTLKWITELAPLFSAAAGGDVQELKRLIDAGVDVNLVGEHNRTALLEAIDAGQEAAVSMLIEHGAFINTDPQTTWPPLVYTIMRRRMSIAKLLVAHGANINVRTVRGYTPLQMAANKGDVEMIRFLLDHARRAGVALDTEAAIAEASERGEILEILKRYRDE